MHTEPQWGEWSMLSGCAIKSEGCSQVRTRICNNTESPYHGQNCTGPDKEVFSCDCPIGISLMLVISIFYYSVRHLI